MEAIEAADNISIREYLPSDIPFIMNSWLTSFKAISDFAKEIPRDIYFYYHHQVIENILQRGSTKILIASNSGDPDLIYGYAVYETVRSHNIFHYIYVKRAFSPFGIATLLLEAAPFPLDNTTYASHMTSKGKEIMKRYDLQYCPYLT